MKFSFRNHPVTRSVLYLLCWTVFALITGAAGGLIGGLFGRAIQAVTGLRTTAPWILYLLPFIGAAIALLYKACHEEKNRGTNAVLSAIAGEESVTVPTGPLIFLSTILSHLGGASVGREGAALQIGGWLGERFSGLMHFSQKAGSTAVMCGMSAVFAALFGTPVAAAVFCIEVAHVGVFHYAALVPCIFSAFTGAGIASALGLKAEIFQIASVPELSAVNLLLSAGLGLLCALLAILLVTTFHGFEKTARTCLPHPVLRAAVCGGLIVGLTLLLGTAAYSGAGANLIELALEGEAHPAAFLLKLVFTVLAIAGGFKGGEIVPTLSIGACFGALFGMLTGLPVSLSAACGMIALFAGATNCPIASLMIAMEMFRGQGLPFFAVTVTLSFVLSGYYSLYGSQRFAFSKIGQEKPAPQQQEASAPQQTEH